MMDINQLDEQHIATLTRKGAVPSIRNVGTSLEPGRDSKKSGSR
jgi:hypothetical protein